MADRLGIDVAHGTRAVCPNCHFEQQLSVTFTNVTFVNNTGMNVAVECPVCRLVFDATGGQDGTYSTDDDGRLRLRQAVFEASSAIFSSGPTKAVAVEELIGVLRAADRTESVADAVASVGMFPALEAWARQNPTLAKVVGTILAALLAAVLARTFTPAPEPQPAPDVNVTVVIPPSEDVLQRLIDEKVQEELDNLRPPPPP